MDEPGLSIVVSGPDENVFNSVFGICFGGNIFQLEDANQSLYMKYGGL